MWSLGRVVGSSVRWVIEQRRRIAKVRRAHPSLCPELLTLLTAGYDDATFSALRETGLPQTTFPAASPWALGEVLGEGWLPG